jgi:DNA repair exonuclease SbcCD ATPase subunit
MDRALMLAVALLIGAGGGFLFGRSNNAAKVAWLEDELQRYSEEAQRASEEQLQRQKEAARLAEQVAQYEADVRSGATTSCPADPAYTDRLRRVLETGRQSPSGG